MGNSFEGINSRDYQAALVCEFCESDWEKDKISEDLIQTFV